MAKQLVSTGQFTLTDQNDYIYQGGQPPLNPIPNTTIWIDTSITPPVQKIWNGTDWVVVNEQTLMGRNLILKSELVLLNSSDNGNGGKSVIENGYVKIIPIMAGNCYGLVKTSFDRIQGEIYTLSFDIQTDTKIGFYWYPSEKYSKENYIESTNGKWKRVKFTYTQSGATKTKDTSFLFGFQQLIVGSVVKHKNLKLEIGTTASNWTPAPEDIQSQIDSVTTTATNVNNLLLDIANDNKLTPTEKQSLKREYDIIVAEKAQVLAQAVPYTSTSTLQTAYTTAYNALVTYVFPLVSNLTITTDTNGVILRQKFSDYFIAKINLLKGITDFVNSSFSGINTSINNLNTYVDGAFKDGVIDAAEAKAIEKYINTVNSEKGDSDSRYTEIYENINLVGTPKSELLTAKNNYDTAHTNLINSINFAIADGKTTVAEKADVDSKFMTYRTTLVILSSKFEKAIQAIQNQAITDIEIGGRNLFLNSKNPRLYTNRQPVIIHSGLELNTAYTLSFTAQNFWSAASLHVEFDGGIGKTDFALDGVYKKFSVTMTTNNSVGNLYLWLIDGEGSVGLKEIKLEKGNKATDWTPAPEDVDASIAVANQNSATALAQAQNAQTTAAAAAAVTNFMQTTVDGNVVSTGTLQVGSVTGANAGITGVVDRPNGESVRFWAGATYANKETAAWILQERGLQVFHHPNGNVGIELGIVNGELVFNAYHESGFKTYEISPNRGFVNVAYIPESFSPQRELFFGSTYNETAIANALRQKITNTLIDYGVISLPGRRYNRRWVIDNLDIIYNYSNGTHPGNEAYSVYLGYKSTNNRTANAANGWYYFNQNNLVASGWDDYGVNDVQMAVAMYRLLNGQVAETKSFNITLYAN